MSQFLALFGFDSKVHSVKTEMMAGLTTFLTMSYILAVNPLILSTAGMERGAVFSATIISAVVATSVMAIYAKLPFCQAPGMSIVSSIPFEMRKSITISSGRSSS